MNHKLLQFIFLLISTIGFGQNLVSDNVNDTISVDKFGQKIAEENNIALSEKWNNYILAVCKKRKSLTYLDPKIKTYYENSYLTSLLTHSYFEKLRGNFKKAITIKLSVLKELEKQKKKNNKLLGYCYQDIGDLLSDEKEYQKAIYYLNKALLYAKKDQDNTNIGNIYSFLGFVYREINNFKLAFYYYNKSYVIFKIYKNDNSIASCLQSTAILYFRNKEFLKAKNNILEAITYNSKTKNFNQLSINYLYLSKLEKKLNNDEASLYYLKKSYDANSVSKNLSSKLHITKELYNYYKSINRKDYALKYLEENIAIDTILNQDENKNAMLKAEFKYETEKKEARIKALSQQKKISELESKRQKTTLLLLIVGIISAVIMGLLFFKRYKTNKQNQLLKSEIEKTQAENKATESELKALKSQMNPHFIFNALNSIQEQFMFGDKLVANEQMGNFTSLTRQILSVSGKKKIPLSSEIDILNKYLELEKMRFETDFEYSIHFDEYIDDEYIELPPMLIQPFVENSIKHGLLHKEGDKKIAVHFALNEDETYLICTVEDNGIGRKKSEEIKQKNQHNSFSTSSVAQRLQMINDNNSSENLVHFDLEDKNKNATGTKVVLKIALV